MKLKEISTKDLTEELMKREGVEIIIAEPYEKKAIEIEGPAIIITVID